MADGNRPEPLPRYDRERWLIAALNALAEEGGAKLRVDALAKRLGVTKGSFYHHFRNRSDFISAVAEYWARAYNDDVMELVDSEGGGGHERLQALMALVGDRGYDRFDIAFRSWAAQDPEVAKLVKAVDLRRYEFVRRMFADMGFEGDDLETRVRTWLVFISAQRAIHTPAESSSPEDVQRLIAFFTRP